MDNSYAYFAEFYDTLTQNISYKSRGKYFYKLLKTLNKPDGILLDLGCGTGSLSEVMSDFSYDVIGIDASNEMLSIAITKKDISKKNILYICQPMENINLYGTVDVCICALDTLNHITDKNNLQKVFNKVSLFLNPDGVFIFDVNTIYKHKNILANNTFIYDFDDVYCVWQNSYSNPHIININLDIFARQKNNIYEKFTEQFDERAYSHDEICEFINNTDLSLVDFYHEDTLEKPIEKTERIVYVVKSTKSK